VSISRELGVALTAVAASFPETLVLGGKIRRPGSPKARY
jgi:hypothetical protein